MRQLLSNFSKGEISPELRGRIDMAQYRAGAAEITNWIIQKTGGLSFRPGFIFVGETDDVETPMRYAPFQFSFEQAYVLTLADEQMRVLALGGFVLEENLKITAITKAANAQLTVAYHAYAVGDRIYLSGISGMTELNGQFATVMSIGGTNTFTIDIDTRGYSTFTASDGTARVGAPPPPPPPPPPATPPPPPPDPPPVGGGGGNWREPVLGEHPL